MTNSEEWEVACVRAGRSSGDLAHPLVYCPELHFSEFTSAMADMKNSVAVSHRSMLAGGLEGWRCAPLVEFSHKIADVFRLLYFATRIVRTPRAPVPASSSAPIWALIGRVSGSMLTLHLLSML